jgi:hypothetical protein
VLERELGKDCITTDKLCENRQYNFYYKFFFPFFRIWFTRFYEIANTWCSSQQCNWTSQWKINLSVQFWYLSFLIELGSTLKHILQVSAGIYTHVCSSIGLPSSFGYTCSFYSSVLKSLDSGYWSGTQERDPDRSQERLVLSYIACTSVRIFS